jgi:hypothetical protein
MRRSRRSFTPGWATKDADLQVVYGSDGTRTRDLRRDRPVLVFPGWAGVGGDYGREQGFSTLALRGWAGAGGSFRRPRAGCVRDAALSKLSTSGICPVCGHCPSVQTSLSDPARDEARRVRSMVTNLSPSTRERPKELSGRVSPAALGHRASRSLPLFRHCESATRAGGCYRCSSFARANSMLRQTAAIRATRHGLPVFLRTHRTRGRRERSR